MDLHEYCLELLRNHHCHIGCYRNCPIEIIIDDLKDSMPNGMEYGFLYRDVANELRRIGDAAPVPPSDYVSAVGYDWESVDDIGGWGILDDECCLYEPHREALKNELASGNDFNTGRHGFKHELESLKVSAFQDKIDVYVSAYCDDLDDLAIDAVCELASDNVITDDEYDLSIDECEGIRESAWGCGYSTEYEDDDTLPRSASIHDVLKMAHELMEGCQERLDETYTFVKNCVQDCYKEYCEKENAK